MPYAIPECHINLRICIADGTQYAVNHIMALVGQEYRAGLRIERIDLADPIILFLRARVLMLAYIITVICSDRGTSNQPGLLVITHGNAIGVITICRVAKQHALINHALKIFRAFSIYRSIVGIGLGW